jgi:hypothetical protein
MLETVFELILELLIQIGGEFFFELGLRSLGETIAPRGERSPILAGFGYALLGLIAGGLSLLIFPNYFVRSERLHGISLLVSPVLAGFGMAGFGWLLEHTGQRRLRLDSFVYGFIFAFPMAIVRFIYTS